MNVHASIAGAVYQSAQPAKESGETKKLTQDQVKELRIEIKSFQVNAAKASLESFGAQQPKRFEDQYADFQEMLDNIRYDGLPIADLSEEEAGKLVAEDGIFGITKTSERLSGFVLSGAGEDIDMLRAGREGIIAGYNQAKEMWGGELPEISQKTLDKALSQIDTKISALGFSAVNLEA